MVLFIQTISDLDKLISSITFPNIYPSKTKFEINFSCLKPEENQKWSEKLNRYYNSCGCHQGSLAILFSMSFYILYLIFSSTVITVDVGVICLLIFVLSALIGKVFGMFIGFLNFKKTIRLLKYDLSTITIYSNKLNWSLHHD